MIEHKIDYCVIAGDLNTDLSRLNSGNTLSLQSFVDNENVAFVMDKFLMMYNILLLVFNTIIH